MNWFLENWSALLVGAVVIAAIVVAVIIFIKMPVETQKKIVKEWLKAAVAEAEKELQSGTGELKLRKCWDWFVTKFKFLSYFVTFETFSGWVDEALEWLDLQIDTNDYIANTIIEKSETKIIE